MKSWITVVASIVAAWHVGYGQDAVPPLERFRQLEFPPIVENFSSGWRERTALEFEIVNQASLVSLRGALDDENAFVRAVAARALGIREDHESAERLASLAQSDPEPMVRIRAVESLSLLKSHADVIASAKKDEDAGVAWTAELIAGQCQSEIPCAEQFRVAFAQGLPPEAIGSAKLGELAPDFEAVTSEGKPFRLSDVVGKKAIAIYFAAFDG